MEELKAKLPKFVKVTAPELCKNAEHMNEKYQSITKAGGEGLMMRRPGSLYSHGRTTAIRKVKQYAESEVKLVEVRKGSLICQNTDGVNFMVRCPPKVVTSPPPIGSVITVKHMEEYGTGALRAAHYFRDRPDLTWEDVLKSKASKPSK